MVTKRRTSIDAASFGKRAAHTGSAKRYPTRVPETPGKRAPARTRTSLVGMTIYQPDIEPSPQGRKLLDALESET
jgi:hypothetical protein